MNPITPRQVEPNFVNRSDCGCGCGRYGVPRKPHRSNGRVCVRGCKCRQCEGGRAKGRATKREHTTAAATGGRRNIGSGAFGGSDVAGGLCEVEETANVALVRGIKRWWTSEQMQRKTAGLFATGAKPRAFVASWRNDPRKAAEPQLVVMTFSDWKWLQEAMVAALAEQIRKESA